MNIEQGVRYWTEKLLNLRPECLRRVGASALGCVDRTEHYSMKSCHMMGKVGEAGDRPSNLAESEL